MSPRPIDPCIPTQKTADRQSHKEPHAEHKTPDGFLGALSAAADRMGLSPEEKAALLGQNRPD